MNTLTWKKYPVLNDGFICLVDHMGDDSAIVQAARVSYGNDKRICPDCNTVDGIVDLEQHGWTQCTKPFHTEQPKTDRQLIRYLLAHSHTTPFEMVEFKFLVRVPMDCWRQWIRHRTASVNEYSTRYTEAIDSQQSTPPGEWRLQATDNKQGSSGYLEEWPEGTRHGDFVTILPNGAEFYTVMKEDVVEKPGEHLSAAEECYHQQATRLYQQRLKLGVAKEQARKDLPLSTYTEAYWKCDLHNIFNFLRLRMDSHAQLEIRSYANAMAEIVKQVVPVAWEAFEDYVLHSKKFSRMEMEIIKGFMTPERGVTQFSLDSNKPDSMTDREWKEFLKKLL